MIELKLGTLLVVRKGEKPQLAQVTDCFDENWVIEFDSDGSIHDYWSLESINEMFEEFKLPMVLYCPTGKSRFCLNFRAGFYWVEENKTPIWLDSSWNGMSVAEVARACKLKAFW